ADVLRLEHATELAERLGLLLTSVSFLVFGAVLLGPTLQHPTWRMLVYAILSLTVVRLLPVAVALLGTGLRPATVAYAGWFGPRGLASLVFGLIALEDHLAGVKTLSGAVAITVGLSVCLHGASASFLGARYGAWFAHVRGRTDLREEAHVPEEAIRLPRGDRGMR
ncbi:MAG TPA: cation:proton antiporter, partial [Streptomyces sp.]